MDLAPLLCVVRATKRPVLFLVQGQLLVISTVSVVLAICLVSCVDFPVVLLILHEPLVTRLKESSLGFESLNACVNDREQIDYRLGLLHGNLLHSFDIADSVVEGVDDLDVLDIRESVPGVTEMFHIVPEALIILLPDSLQSLSSRWTLVRALEVLVEHGT
jgi:hypothetical protein